MNQMPHTPVFGAPEQKTVEGDPGKADGEPETASPRESREAEDREEGVAPASGAPEAAEEPGVAEEEAGADTLKEKLLRAMAEVENIRRRAERDRVEATRFGIMKFARDILPVADNMLRALEAAQGHSDEAPDAMSTLVDGIEATRREFLTIMERHGVKPVNPAGQRFDPHLHEALFEVPGTGQPPGVVVEVFRIGYVLDDKLLRPAQVAVAGVADGKNAGTAATQPEGQAGDGGVAGNGGGDNSDTHSDTHSDTNSDANSDNSGDGHDDGGA